MKFEYFPSSELSHSNMTNKIDGKKCRLIDPLKNLNRPETKIFCPRFSHEIKKRKNSQDMNILVSEFSGTPPPPSPKTHNEQCSGWGEIYVSWAANASKKPFFKKKNCNIYQILCQLKLVIIEENMDAVWKDVIQPRRVPLHDESVHNACAIIKMVIHQDHTKKTCFRRLLFYIPPKSF